MSGEAWLFEPGAAFLNHGSFGACPRDVLTEQARWRAKMESAPDAFFRYDVMPRREGPPAALPAAAAELAAFVDAGPDQVAFVENATLGTHAALRSFPLAPGNEILITNHTYNAVRLMVEARCAETGASVRVVDIPLPVSADEIVARVTGAITPSVKLAILDHITSPTAIVMPLERISPLLRGQGVRVIVDGAHAVGHIPLSMRALRADWYVSNAHKWLFAPRGTAFLHASDEVAGFTEPPLVSHFVAMGFPRSFDWLGTRDYSAWLSVPAAIRFWRGLDPDRVRQHQAALLEECTALLRPMGIDPIAPMELCPAMRSFVLPQRRAPAPEDAIAFMRDYWEKERIQAMAVVFGDKLLMRISAHAYVGRADIQRLVTALGKLGWPGR